MYIGSMSTLGKNIKQKYYGDPKKGLTWKKYKVGVVLITRKEIE